MDKFAVKNIILLFAALFILLACEIPVLTAPASAPSEPELVPIDTIIAGTVAAAQTQTAVMLPSPTLTLTSTPLPTLTPTETATSTPTVIFIIPTSTKPFEPHSVGSNCYLATQKPVNNAVFVPDESFDAEWTLRNTGDEIWSETDIDFKYTSGRDMHKTDVLDLPFSVGTNEDVTLTVAMVAPDDPGSYTSTWVLSTKKKTYCKVSVTIIVE